MKDYGQIIAIAVGIIILAINAMNKKKPKQNSPTSPQQKPPNRQPNTGIPSLDEILREFSGQTNTPKPESLEDETTESYETLETTDSLEQVSPFEKYNSNDYQFSYETLSNSDNLKKEQAKIVDYHELHKDDKTIEEDEFEFNIRDAVLFSEILKRPSY